MQMGALARLLASGRAKAPAALRPALGVLESLLVGEDPRICAEVAQRFKALDVPSSRGLETVTAARAGGSTGTAFVVTATTAQGDCGGQRYFVKTLDEPDYLVKLYASSLERAGVSSP